jgi:hypothetical protein
VVSVILAAHVSLAPHVAGVDAFYHVGHAVEYAEHGLFDTSFPWATQSVIGDLGADLWWGFHVVLTPFAATGDVIDTIRVAAFLLTLALAAMVWWVLERHAIRHAGWWTLAVLLAVPNVLYRFLMVRPHVLSLGLGLALASVLARGRWWQVLLVATTITWLHLGMFWLAPGVVVAYLLVRLGERMVRDPSDEAGGSVHVPAAVASVATGTTLGWLLRPHPWAAGELAWTQIVLLMGKKGGDQPLAFASEMVPLSLGELLRTSWMFTLAWALALAVGVAGLLAAARGRRAEAPEGEAARLPVEEARFFATSLSISLVFLILALLSARRALVEMVVFGTAAAPFAWTLAGTGVARRRVGLAMAVLACAHVPWAAWRHALNATFVAFPPDLMAASAAWLEENTAPGDIVFHVRWDNFGPLFAHNRSNRYLGGMDPIFQYEHDPGRYWEHFYLAGDLLEEYTCDAFPCYEGTATPTHAAIRDHFGARWVLVEPVRNPKLTQQLRDDPGFALVHETRGELIFRVEG